MKFPDTCARRGGAAAVALIFGPLLSTPVLAASFDCTQARTVDERLICGTPALSTADAAVGAAYRSLVDALAADEAGRTQVRNEQRAWVARRNRQCGLAGAGAVADDGTVECLTAVLAQRLRWLTALRANLPLTARLRLVVADDRGSTQRGRVFAEYPEITEPSLPGAAAFNEAMRRFVATESARFQTDAAELPPQFEPELTVTAEPFFPAPGIISVQFRSDGVLGNGFRDAAAVTVDLNHGRVLTAGEIFAGTAWSGPAVAACRRAVAPAVADDACDARDLADLRHWRFEPAQAVITVLLPGKELREIAVPYSALAGQWRPGGPLGARR